MRGIGGGASGVSFFFLFSSLTGDSEREWKKYALGIGWHSRCNLRDRYVYFRRSFRNQSREARETGLDQLLSTARTWASGQFFGGEKQNTSFRLMVFGTQKLAEKPKRSHP